VVGLVERERGLVHVYDPHQPRAGDQLPGVAAEVLPAEVLPEVGDRYSSLGGLLGGLSLLEVRLPGMSGARTYQALREIAPKVKVLLTNGYSEERQARELLARGCDGFLQKPFDVDALSEKLRSLL
jgi:DNA-binding NarL/FixJ family response regulator